MDFCRIVKIVREKMGMRQEDLARALNVSFAAINRWENGKTHPNKLTQATFFDFCEKYGLNIKSIIAVLNEKCQFGRKWRYYIYP